MAPAIEYVSELAGAWRLTKPKTVASTVWAVLLLASLTGCGGPGSGAEEAPPDEEVAPASPTGSTLQEEDPAGEAGAGDEAVPDDEVFPSPESASGGTEGAADGIREVSVENYAEYERAVIEFGTKEEAASQAPVWSLGSSPEGGYVRVSLPGVTSMATAGGDFVGIILDEYYVVRDPEGGLFVDVFALDDFAYRVTELSDPGRIAIDFRREEGGLESPVVKGEDTIVLQPREGEIVTGPLAVSGYSRNFEAANTVALVGEDGELLASESVTASDYAEAYGYFETTLKAPGSCEGEAAVRVGAEDPRDGVFEGVEVPVYLLRGGRE